MARPLTVENQWDVLYPTIPRCTTPYSYTPFSYTPDPVDAVTGRFGLRGRVVDAGVREYGSRASIVATCSFIFGSRAIDHLR